MLGRASVQLIDLKKSFGEFRAVDGVNLDVRPGEFLTLLGPSGSGKTTTLLMIAGFAVPDAGDVRIGDTSIVRLPPHRRNVGMVFQNYALFPHMTVGENIAFPLQMRKMSRAEIVSQTSQVLALVGLPGYEGRYPRQLSGGQQQLVGVARAVIAKPRLVLADEPTGNLHSSQAQEIMELFVRLNQEGTTIVQVTHSEANAEYGHRIVNLKDGWVVSDVRTRQG